jgi:pimeloyl-ACP methyl ester carboxylesterase
LEVWTVHLRGQGGSERGPGARGPSLSAWSRVDLPRAIAAVLEETETGADRLDGVGCSLGATVWYAHLAFAGAALRAGALVTLGGPLRWAGAPLLVRATLGLVPLGVVGRLRLRGTRALARRALPMARHVPPILSMYMNARGIDLRDAGRLAESVDDPDPALNVELARWVRSGSLVVDGLDVAGALSARALPILAVAANRDGIVPPSAVRSVEAAAGGPVTYLEVGDAQRWFAHADLFINDEAEARVFAPVAEWLAARAG